MFTSPRFSGIWNPAAIQPGGTTVDLGPVLKPQPEGFYILDESQHKAAQELADRFHRQEIPVLREEGVGRRMFVFTEDDAGTVKDRLDSDEGVKAKHEALFRISDENQARMVPLDERIAALQEQINELERQKDRLRQPGINALHELWEARRQIVQTYVDQRADTVQLAPYRGSRSNFTFVPVSELEPKPPVPTGWRRLLRYLPGASGQ